MNHIYRIVWNQTKTCWQAVCETANGHPRGTSSRRASGTSRNVASVRPRTRLKLSHAALLCGFGLMTSSVGAAPTGGQVSAGTATISQSGATTTIQQASQKAAIDWTGFSVGKTESVRFNQPNASAITLNRVTGTERSEILGSLSANGQVFILNPNGVLFGKGAQVNVGGIVASTLRMSNEDFMAGNFRLTEGPNARASVSNEGEIRVAEGGVLALIAPVVTNTGTLAAPQGSVLMAAADAVSVTLQDGSLVSYTIDKGNLQALVDNGGVIHAEGGHVVLTAKGLDALSKAVVNHSGIIEAQTVSTKNGVVELLGDMEVGQVNLSGRVDASAPRGGNGGSVEARAETVTVSGEARVTTLAAQGQTGNWMIVGTDPAIVSSGGVITGALLSANLADTNVTIRTGTDGLLVGNGQISVNDVVSWSSNTLTLIAGKNIYINATMNGRGAASLVLNYGQTGSAVENPWDYFLSNGAKINLPAGPSFSTKVGADGLVRRYTVISSLGSEGSNSITTLQGVGSNGNWYCYALGSDIDAAETRSWNSGAGFSPIQHIANFDGFGHAISNLYINRPSEGEVGLFRVVLSPRLVNRNNQYIDRYGTIRNLSVNNANIIGNNSVGIISGRNTSVGLNLSSSGYVAAEGGVVGGVFGNMSSGYIFSSFSNATVRGGYSVGGLIGENLGGTVADSYATGDVTLTQRIFSAGGLVGLAAYGAKVLNSYSTGQVLNPNGGADVGGLIGSMVFDATVSASYFDSEKSGTMLSAGGEPRSTAEMQQKKTFSGWDFNNTWRIVEGSSYPMLRALTQGKITLTAAARDVAKVYNKIPWFGGGVVDYSGFAGTDSPSDLSGSIQWGGTSQGAIDAGLYTLIPSGLYSQKYEIDFKPATLYIAPRILDVSVSKPYDGSGTFNTGFSVKNVLPGDTVNITGEATVASVDAGTYTAFTSNTLSTGNKNYTLNPVNTPNYSYGSFGSVTATIDPAVIRLLGISGRRVYDGTPNAYWNDSISFQGLIEADKEKVYLVSGSGTLSGKDVGGHRLLSINTLRLSGSASNNYILDLNGSSWTIDPRPVDVIASKVFDGTSLFSSGFVVSSETFGNVVNVSGHASVASSDAANYFGFVDSSLTVDNKNFVFSSDSKVSAAIQRAPVSIWVLDQKIKEGEFVAPYQYKVVRSDTGEEIGSKVLVDVVYSSEAERKYKQYGYGVYSFGIDGYRLNSGNYFVSNMFDGTLLVTPKLVEYFFGAQLESVRGALNGNLPKYEEAVAYGSPWKLLPPNESVLHDNGNGLPERKYVHTDGREVVFDGDTHQILRGGLYGGTFNFSNNSESTLRHAVFDMAPSWQLREICSAGYGGFSKCAGSVIGNDVVARIAVKNSEDVGPHRAAVDSGESVSRIEGDRMKRYASVSELNIFTAYYGQAIGAVNESLKNLHGQLFNQQSSWMETILSTEESVSHYVERLNRIDLNDPNSLIRLVDEIAEENKEFDRDINKIKNLSVQIDGFFDIANVLVVGEGLFAAAGLTKDAVGALSIEISKHKGRIADLDKSMIDSLNEIVRAFPGAFDDEFKDLSFKIMRDRNVDASLAKLVMNLIEDLSLRKLIDASEAASAVYDAFELLAGVVKVEEDKNLYIEFLTTADKKDVHKIYAQNYLVNKLGLDKAASQNVYSITRVDKFMPWDDPLFLTKINPDGVVIQSYCCN